MSDLPNARFNELPINAVLKPGYLGAVLNMESNVTEGFDFAQLLLSTTTGNFEWLPGPKTYNVDEVVTWHGLWWQAVQNVPVNIVPGTDGEVYWVQVDKSSSGFVFWQAGVYTDDVVIVLKDVSIAQDLSDVRAFILGPTTTRPYVSSNFATELAAGDWIQILFPSTTDTEVLRNKGDWTDATKYPDATDLGYTPVRNMFWVVATGTGITLNGNFWPDDTMLVVKTTNPGQDDTKWYRRA